MNIAFFTRPKQEITYLYNDITVDQALEKMHSTSYAAVPVIDREGHYVGTVSEGDFGMKGGAAGGGRHPDPGQAGTDHPVCRRTHYQDHGFKLRTDHR